jgi:sugar phosphate isomerase/epimerase
MRIGVEGQHVFDARRQSATSVLDQTKAIGLSGVFFKSATHISATLDRGEMREVKAHADDLGLYLESSVGSINPYNVSEDPYVRDLGDGDTLRGYERMIEASAEIGCVDLGATTAHFHPHYPGPFACDRFRTDVTWPEQLEAVQRLLTRLAPVLRDSGARISIETHEEITSFEVVRLIEAVGADIVSAGFDTGNVLRRGEDPVEAAKRLAPYVRTTHIKDAVLRFADGGLTLQSRAVGDGIIDWRKLLGILHADQPHLTLSLEDGQGTMWVGLADVSWPAGHPDQVPTELAAIIRAARECEDRIASGEWVDMDAYDAEGWETHRFKRIERSRAVLQELLDVEEWGEP